jgi:hypothetical protein
VVAHQVGVQKEVEQEYDYVFIVSSVTALSIKTFCHPILQNFAVEAV